MDSVKITSMQDGSVSDGWSEQCEQVYAVDGAGNFLGLVDKTLPSIALVVPPPGGIGWVWNFKTSLWNPPVTNEQKRADILLQIVAIEGKQDRAVREAILTNDDSMLASLDAQIKDLRAQLALYPDATAPAAAPLA